jgi:hypothetical protein
MKMARLSLCLLFVLGARALGAEIDDLAASICGLLPNKGWTVESRVTSLAIIGPKVKMIWPGSLPFESDEKLWREYAQSERVEMIIKFQRGVSDSDLVELRRLRDRFDQVTESGVDRKKKDWGEQIEDFGFIRLPDYRSASASIFVQRNTDGYWVRPVEVLDVFANIEKLLAARFEKVSDGKDMVNQVPKPTPTAVTPPTKQEARQP